MLQRKYVFFTSLLILAFLPGCVAGTPAATSPSVSPTRAGTPAPTVTPDTSQAQSPAPTLVSPQPTLGTPRIPEVLVTPAPDLAALVEQAKADLANKLNVQAASIQVVEAESVEWPDGSLGCPKPGIMYIQMVTPGTMIRLQYAGKIYEYHSGGSRPPFYCENPR